MLYPLKIIEKVPSYPNFEDMFLTMNAIFKLLQHEYP